MHYVINWNIRSQFKTFHPEPMKIYKALVVIFIMHCIQMNVGSFQDTMEQVSSLNTDEILYNQNIVQRLLQKRYMKIDFLTLYRIHIFKASGKLGGKRKL